ncbi:11668_t:CDS:2 [Ambispora gerdemannii]|uniref:11668_t:CDS:1 n=1 Tax=Ambispora gerdemannii TaxID=144530 RepID=A0A9N9A0Q3_9GLOM|nr:11668_t:CDS:2 [Ambispora gerdemannii]
MTSEQQVKFKYLLHLQYLEAKEVLEEGRGAIATSGIVVE